jgi:hypothetical protein
MPGLTPFSAISMLSNKAIADQTNSKSVGYYFYQTTKGFYFRSFESMCVNSNGVPREVKQEFNYMVANVDEKVLGPRHIKDKPVPKIISDYTTVEQYNFLNNFHDVAMSQAAGTYAHRVITHNIFNKSYKVSDYHYHDNYKDTQHTDGNNPPIVKSPVDYDQKGVSDYPESRVTVMATTQFSHDEGTGSFGIDVEQDGITEAARISQKNAVSAGTRLKLTVKGMSYLQPGDVIQFNILSVENKTSSDGALDPHYAGRYIISAIRHRVTDREYIQVLECVKDSLYKGYNNSSYESYQAKPIRGKSYSVNINAYDNYSSGRLGY